MEDKDEAEEIDKNMGRESDSKTTHKTCVFRGNPPSEDLPLAVTDTLMKQQYKTETRRKTKNEKVGRESDRKTTNKTCVFKGKPPPPPQRPVPQPPYNQPRTYIWQ